MKVFQCDALFYRSYSCIRREFLPNDDYLDKKYADDLGEASFENNGVEFSLNKKRRWMLPRRIQRQILEESSDEDIDIQLAEYHRIYSRTANCVRFTSRNKPLRTGIRETKSKSKRRGYFDVSSILNEKPPERNRNRHNNGNVADGTEGDTDEIVPCKMKYQVLYPSPATSYTSHCHKYINYGILSRDQRSSGTLRKKLSRYIRDSLEETDNGFDDCLDKDVGPYNAEERTNEIIIELDDILKSAEMTESHNRGSGKIRSRNIRRGRSEMSKFDKSHIIYIDPETNGDLESRELGLVLQNTIQTSTVQTTSQKCLIVEPIVAVISVLETTSGELRRKFGKNYIECDCFPRKFIINISEEVAKHDVTGYDTYITFACLTFVHDVDNEINSQKKCVFKVYLNTRFNDYINYIKMETIPDDNNDSIGTVIQKAVSFIQTLPIDGIIREKKSFTRPSTFCSKSTLETCANWKSSSYRPEVERLFQTFVQNQNESMLESREDLGFEVVSEKDLTPELVLENSTPKDKFCSICYDELGDLVGATALTSCRHWFCDSCWREHLITCVRNGRPELFCPEYDCDKRLDKGTLLSLLTLDHVIRYLKLFHDMDVEQQPITKWCPNPVCGRVLVIESSEVQTASCQCGKRVCFDCLGDVHWPAQCTAAAVNKQKLLKNGDDDIIPTEVGETVIVSGKHCPFCKRFVEKNGGCPQMTCLCGNLFCWGCGKAWKSGKHDAECYRNGSVNTHGTKDVFIEPEDRTYLQNKRISKWFKSAQWYKVAVVHRTRRQHIKFQKLNSSVDTLVSKLKFFVRRTEKNKELISFDFELPNKIYSWEGAKARDFLVDTMQLYAELHQIIEHVAVFLDNVNLSRNLVVPIQNTVNKMSALAGFLYELLLHGAAQDTKYVFMKLKEIRHRSKTCIAALVKYNKN